jgi:hypothetical protein
VVLYNWDERKHEKITLIVMELMIDIVASALTFEHWASTQQEQGHRLCRSQSTSSTHSDSGSDTRIYRQNMPHLERPIVPHMRLIESLPNLSLYDAWRKPIWANLTETNDLPVWLILTENNQQKPIQPEIDLTKSTTTSQQMTSFAEPI